MSPDAFHFLLDPSIWLGFVTLLVLEVVLGIDNLVFIAILANKASSEYRDKARVVGLSLAVIIRIAMLAGTSYILTLTQPLFEVSGFAVSGKDIIMLLGGLFLLYKATTELHERLEGHTDPSDMGQMQHPSSFWSVVGQILVLDAVFSIDSVITAVAIVDNVQVAMAAVVVAMVIMIWASKSLTHFVARHPTVVMLCLGFLLMIGFSLIAEGLHFHIPKGYLYAAIAFSILIEVFNQISTRNSRLNDMISKSWRRRTAESVLGMMGLRESVLAGKEHQDGDTSHFEENEKSMIRSVLTLAERPILAVMTPRNEIEKLDVSQSKEQQHQQLQETPFSRLIVIGKAGIDEPLGYLNKKDLLLQLLSEQTLDIQAALKQPLMLPETATVLDAIELFRARSADFSLVVDEFGAVLGMLTMKDLIEAIAGDFPEEYERLEAPSIQTEADDSLTIDGNLEYESLTRQIKLPPLPEGADYHTVAGLIMAKLQTIPNEGDTLHYAGYVFEVLEKDNRRIERVRIYPAQNI